MDAASSKTILIVEDERDVIDLLTLNLRKSGGFVVSTATDGVAGLHKARTEKPAFIILDLMLPKMSGLEVCKILKSDLDTRQIPIARIPDYGARGVAHWANHLRSTQSMRCHPPSPG